MRLRGAVLVSGAVATGVACRALRVVAASSGEVASRLSGDDLVPDATVSMDRAADFSVSPDVLWPWIAQLGKGRGGWYFPRWLDMVTPPARRATRRIEAGMTTVGVGDEHSDWGPGEPVLRVTEIEEGRTIVYHSLRDRTRNFRWPLDGQASLPDVFAMSWQISLRPVAGGSRLHLRVRARAKTRVFAKLADVYDGLTVALLFAGIRERVER